MPFDLTPAGWVGASIGGVIGLFLAGLLLRSSCDLCGVDPAPNLVEITHAWIPSAGPVMDRV